MLGELRSVEELNITEIVETEYKEVQESIQN